MKLICPACGAQASVEAWKNDTDCRAAMAAVIELPPAVQQRAFAYVGLFRSLSGRGITWAKALKVLRELVEMVKPGTVQWEGWEERPAPPSLWAKAMDQTLLKVTPPLQNHNYLRRTTWSMAEQLAGQSERQREDDLRRRAPAPAVPALPAPGELMPGPGEEPPAQATEAGLFDEPTPALRREGKPLKLGSITDAVYEEGRRFLRELRQKQSQNKPEPQKNED